MTNVTQCQEKPFKPRFSKELPSIVPEDILQALKNKKTDSYLVVYKELVSQAQHKHNFRCSLPYLVEKTGKSQSTVQRVLRFFKKLGIVTSRQYWNASNEFFFNKSLLTTNALRVFKCFFIGFMSLNMLMSYAAKECDQLIRFKVNNAPLTASVTATAESNIPSYSALSYQAWAADQLLSQKQGKKGRQQDFWNEYWFNAGNDYRSSNVRVQQAAVRRNSANRSSIADIL